jgi:hypothetical protein
MKNVICLAVFCAVLSVVYSQSETLGEEFEEDYYTSMKDIRESEKFRIGVDISTPTVGFLAGANLRPRASLIFNVKTAPNRAWRFIPMYEQNRRFTDFQLSSFNAYEVNDSSIVYRNEHQEEYRLAARLGTEWFKQYERNTLVYGIDLVVGYGSEYSELTNSYQRYDENGRVENFAVGRGFFDEKDVYNEEVFRLLIGVDFSVGYKFFLGEKTDFTIEWIPEYTYRPYLKTESHGNPLLGGSSDINDVGVFDIRGLSIQVHYKFLKK